MVYLGTEAAATGRRFVSLKDIPEGRSTTVNFSRFQSQRQTRVLLKDERHVAIAVVGATGSGKTTFINQASGANLLVGMGLQSCTASVQVAPPFELAGYLVTLIDTPGFDDTTRNDADILRTIAEFLAREHGRTLAGILYLHRISDKRMSGISRRNFNVFKQLCGDDTLKNVVIVSNMWGQVDEDVGDAREQELTTNDTFLKPALDKGAKMVRHDNTPMNARAILRHLVGMKPLPLRIQTEMVREHKDVWQTAAGEEAVGPELTAQNKKHVAEVARFQRYMEEEMSLRDEDNRNKVREESQRFHVEINQVRENGERLAAQLDAEKQQMERRMEEEEQVAEREAERQRAEITNLHQMLHDQANASSTQREDLQRQLNDAVRHYQQRNNGGCNIM
ncbi:hypothetical protein E1B28_011044 [Marasmius oreades]|uniref:G domain-containing protein n=1 Tax=Marasmius oreades TaxID=181124 RepID=A0A9P7RTB1_9AGAR|nr:uncharacterized protein E1B28_011044 [Marasmius oreades]KAG7089354.1 hypothetical protein E1B28_011044 [Marasmius oreades]